jgi:hypothetical protein
MIRTKSDMNLLCQKKIPDLSEYERRLILFNYIYHTKGREIHEIFTVPLGSDLNYAANLHKAYRYYVNL